MTEEEAKATARPESEAYYAVRKLTRHQKRLVHDGSIHGDFQMRTVRELERLGMFHLVIDSPNGQCGFMRLTPLGEAVQALIKSRKPKPTGRPE